MIMAEGTLGNLMEPIVMREPVLNKVDKPWAISGCQGRKPNIINTLHLGSEELENRNLHLANKYKLIQAQEKRAENLLERCGIGGGSLWNNGPDSKKGGGGSPQTGNQGRPGPTNHLMAFPG